MPHDVISTCPVCSHELLVTRLRCPDCGTTIDGEFAVGRFGRLNRDQLALLESFLRSRGNLRDMERELGISYPTVRSRVESLVRTLGFPARAGSDEVAPDDAPTPPSPPPPPAASSNGDVADARRQILERLANHQLSAEDAASAIRLLGRSR
ncbi:MAG: DUF2089 domain-containing protein [Chloroflexota bacterium]